MGLLEKVKNSKDIEVDNLDNSIFEHISHVSDPEAQASFKTLATNAIKYHLTKERPDLYKSIEKMDYDGLKQHIKANPDGSAVFEIPKDFLAALPEGEVGTYGTSFQISPNSFGANITNVLNKVSVGDNLIDFGESFNAYEIFHTESLDSGEAKLVTQGYSIAGTCLLDQNTLVPNSTQTTKGYQASLGVFINMPDAQSVGGGQGIGLFNLYPIPRNVIKLAVTNPAQFGQMVKIFYATAANTKAFTLGMITTANFLHNINNVIYDGSNADIRTCLNGTLFPALKTMQNPTNEFNIGIPTQYGTGGTAPASDLNLKVIMTGGDSLLKTITSTIRAKTLKSNYLVSGNQSLPRIQTSKRDDIHLIVTPHFFTALKSGTLSELFHGEFQELNAYVKPENIHLLYKQVEIEASNMNVQVNGKYVQQTTATMGSKGIPDNAIVVYTKPSDTNNGCAQYYDVWEDKMENEGGAGMVSTAFLHYAIGGGVIPGANGFLFVALNLLKTKAGPEQPVMYDFTLGKQVDVVKPAVAGE